MADEGMSSLNRPPAGVTLTGLSGRTCRPLQPLGSAGKGPRLGRAHTPPDGRTPQAIARVAWPRAVRDALGTSALRRLQAAWAASSVGGWALFVALSIYAYDVGGASAVGLAAVVRMAPAALAAPAMSVLGDRYSRRNVLLVLCLVRALVLAAMAAVVARDGPAAVVFALAALFTAIGTGHRPAQAALLPALADEPRQLAASNGLWSAIDSVGFLVGAAGGGLLVAAGGVEFAFAATCGAFLLAALALAGIPVDARPADPARRRRPRLGEIAEGSAPSPATGAAADRRRARRVHARGGRHRRARGRRRARAAGARRGRRRLAEHRLGARRHRRGRGGPAPRPPGQHPRARPRPAC